jgi:uncharacterized membrane protein HdeD (DUF308 family)
MTNVGVRKAEIEGAAAGLLKRSWWAVGIRGVLAIVLGIFALVRPGMTLTAFLVTLGVYLVADGLVTIFSAFYARRQGETFWPYLFEGLVSVGVGILGLVHPGPIAMILLVLVAARSIIVGLIEIGTGLSARRMSGWSALLLGIAGVASVAFGLVLLRSPSVGMLALAWSFGIYAIAFGLLLDVQAFQVRRASRRLEGHSV